MGVVPLASRFMNLCCGYMCRGSARGSLVHKREHKELACHRLAFCFPYKRKVFCYAQNVLHVLRSCHEDTLSRVTIGFVYPIIIAYCTIRGGVLVAVPVPNTRQRKICVRAVYYLLNSIDRLTSLEIREFTLPGPGLF